MNKVIIYTLIDPRTNIDMYVGCTTMSINDRYNAHLGDTSMNTSKSKWILELKSHNMLPKIEVLDEVSNKEVSFWERHYISLFKSWGINLVNGNNGGCGIPNGKTHKKIIQYSIDGELIKIWDSISKAALACCGGLHNRTHISLAAKKKNRSAHGYVWRYYTDDYQNKIDVFINVAPSSKKVYQYSLDGKFIKEWPSSASACRCHGMKGVTIHEVLKGNQRSAFGYFWSREFNPDGLGINLPKTMGKRKVVKCDLNDNIVEEFESIQSAQLAQNGKIKGCVNDCLYGYQKTAYGYKWKYV
nr:NUMOD1 domain-containing DNA-binding protein [uncultured Flavobacterium sp.]